MNVTSSVSWSLFEPVADHLWQSTFVLAVITALTVMFRNNRAQVRHWLWLVASVKFAVPFAALTAIGSGIAWPEGRAVVSQFVAPAVVVAEPFGQVVLPLVDQAGGRSAYCVDVAAGHRHHLDRRCAPSGCALVHAVARHCGDCRVWRASDGRSRSRDSASPRPARGTSSRAASRPDGLGARTGCVRSAASETALAAQRVCAPRRSPDRSDSGARARTRAAARQSGSARSHGRAGGLLVPSAGVVDGRTVDSGTRARL